MVEEDKAEKKRPTDEGEESGSRGGAAVSVVKFGRTLADEDWIKKTTTTTSSNNNNNNNKAPAYQAQYYDPMSALCEPYKYMSARLAEANQALNDYLDGHVYAIKAHCEALSRQYEEEEEKEKRESTELDIDEEEKELRLMINDLADGETLMGRITEKTAVETYYVGRIHYGQSKVGGRLNPRQVLLEASCAYAKGDIVPLDLSLLQPPPPPLQSESSEQENASPPPKLPPMSLFPGAIVLLKGQNPTGTAITVSRFIDLGELFHRGPRGGDFPGKCPPALLLSEETTDHHCSNAPPPPSAMSIVCASGPFVSFEGGSAESLNLADSTYMKALAGYLKQHSPDYLLLFGPFLDAEQRTLITEWCLLQSLNSASSSSSSPANWTGERLFNHQLRTLTKELEGLKEVRTQILYIPSASEFPGGPGSEAQLVFPTAPVARQYQQPGVQYYADPAMLSLGGVTVGATATDILRHIAQQEISNISSAEAEGQAAGASKAGQNRLHRLAAHLLAHKHFYPLLPAEAGVNLECSQYEKLTMPVTPHLLILPSMLRPFVYNIQQTVVVNPGKVNKNSIARILIDPVKVKDSAAAFDGSIAQYVNVEVIKLIS